VLCSMLSYGQKITFHKNSNYKADVLKQNLNKAGDSLLLESKTEEIIKIAIFNENYSTSIDVGSYKTKIDLKTLPLGNFIIQAKLNQKWIVMYLEKYDELKDLASLDKKKNDTSKITASHQDLNNKDNQSTTTNYNTFKVPQKMDAYYYWVVTESNSSFGSNRTMRLEYKEDIAKLIYKAKLELKSDIAKNNKLFIYEVYNKSKFMSKQLRNPDYYKSEESTLFNVEPIYESVN
ncbi:MAG: hypothetical protein KDD05_04470, partial [Psychroserpens sp.]|nr:hypothetical protein [Psychroserpens sp.]